MLDEKEFTTKKYLHFDHRVKIEFAESYVTNPLKIARHSFLPLIHYTSSFNKYNGVVNKGKQREIMYAGHWDHFIYKYYAKILNTDYYNEFCHSFGIDECVTAYRNNKTKKSNIDFAAEVIERIVSYQEAYILIGDFTDYFSSLDHGLLKNNLKRVMNVSKLSADWYNVFRSVTKYGYYEKNDVMKSCGRDADLKFQHKKSYFEQLIDFRRFQKENPAKYNRGKHGVPQGTAISAVFANLYAIDFDLNMTKLANKFSGCYRRYSDDFILVIPKGEILNLGEFKKIEIKVRGWAELYKIIIQETKTGLYLYENKKISNINKPEDRRLDYLGFVFDGKKVKMRGKSPYKFYRKAKQLINLAQSRKEEKDLVKLPYRKSIYRLYTDLGKEHGEFGNFISYAQRAQMKFDKLSPHTQNLMMAQINNRKKKIEKMLGVKIHIKI
ncbi:RNA-dependent DNA polymerase [Listeria grandensis]|uniref:RNA-dependent DNA polymerase n=1 Tax=Listeria grandensis TaxID=1494963 RepID=A0A7X0Y1U5_9LIST|nr:reverse transcriptase domain-containing protein [Listeria grandensis]MBC1935324.1 RNA-dependent DNA polymerase [Listeria grandensis]